MASDLAARLLGKSRTPRTTAQIVVPVATGTAFPELKLYATRLKEYDLGKVADAIILGTAPRLAGNVFDNVTSCEYKDADASMEKHNLEDRCAGDVFKALSEHEKYDKDTGIVAFTDLESETVTAALKSYVSLLSAVSYDHKSDTWSLRLLHKGEDWGSLPSGWANEADGYNTVNLPPGTAFTRAEQQKVVFACGGKELKHLCKAHELSYFRDKVLADIKKLFPKKLVIVEEAHILFAFHNHVHFSYHQDTKDLAGGTSIGISVIFQLSPGFSSMHVAGADKEFKYTFPGSCAAFDADVFHRSGQNEMRTVKVVFFVSLADDNAVEVGEEEEEVDVELEVEGEGGEEDQEEEQEEEQDGDQSSVPVSVPVLPVEAAKPEQNALGDGTGPELPDAELDNTAEESLVQAQQAEGPSPAIVPGQDAQMPEVPNTELTFSVKYTGDPPREDEAPAETRAISKEVTPAEEGVFSVPGEETAEIAAVVPGEITAPETTPSSPPGSDPGASQPSGELQESEPSGDPALKKPRISFSIDTRTGPGSGAAALKPPSKSTRSSRS